MGLDLSLEYFVAQMLDNPLMLVAVLLTLGVILVNGWTDAPNAIATCVSTRCMPVRAAILMAAVFNFLGVFVMTMLSPKVAETITKMVDFGNDQREATIALSAAMFAIVLWATLAVISFCKSKKTYEPVFFLDVFSVSEGVRAFFNFFSPFFIVLICILILLAIALIVFLFIKEKKSRFS